MKYLKPFIALSLLLLCSTRAFSQETIESVAKEVCKELSKIDLSDTSVPAAARVGALIKDMIPRIEHGKVIENYKKKHPETASLPQQQLEDRMITDIACLLMKDCKPFLAITMNQGKLMPDVSKSGAAYCAKFDALLAERLKTSPMSQALVNECTTRIAEENKGEMLKKYGEDYMTLFGADLRSHLLTNCEPYKRWTVGNMIKQFRMLQNFGL